jgi:hypothetical protein
MVIIRRGIAVIMMVEQWQQVEGKVSVEREDDGDGFEPVVEHESYR